MSSLAAAQQQSGSSEGLDEGSAWRLVEGSACDLLQQGGGFSIAAAPYQVRRRLFCAAQHSWCVDCDAPAALPRRKLTCSPQLPRRLRRMGSG